MNREEADRFVGSWVQAWNAHDLDLVLGHFSDEVLFTSPVAAQLLAGSDGVIRGKRALRKYWWRPKRGVNSSRRKFRQEPMRLL